MEKTTISLVIMEKVGGERTFSEGEIKLETLGDFQGGAAGGGGYYEQGIGYGNQRFNSGVVGRSRWVALEL